MKNPLTPAGIEPATFRIVAQHLSHCAIALAPPPFCTYTTKINPKLPYYFITQGVFLDLQRRYKNGDPINAQPVENTNTSAEKDDSKCIYM